MAHHRGARDLAESPDMRQAEGPYPVSNVTTSLGCFFSRATILRASSNGQAFELSAISRSAAASASIVDIDVSRARTLETAPLGVNLVKTGVLCPDLLRVCAKEKAPRSNRGLSKNHVRDEVLLERGLAPR